MTTARAMPAAGAGETTRVGVLLAIVDFPLLGAAFRGVIDRERDMCVVGESTSSESIVADVRATGADVVVTACEGGGGFGCPAFASIESIRAACPDTKIIALDCRCAADQFSLALKAGANGYLTRDSQDVDVVAAVRSVAAGHTYVSPAIVTRMIDTFVRRTPDPTLDDPYETLTEREREILLLASMGHTNRDIARSLHLSEQTVHYHRASMMEKLGLHDRVELLRYTVRRGLLNPANL
jgi:two-component system, NarL family, response regulator NreC